MKITQELVNNIVERAKASRLGLGEPARPTMDALNIDGYAQHNLLALAMLLVTAYDEKYDLISVFLAALETVEQEATIETAGRLSQVFSKPAKQEGNP